MIDPNNIKMQHNNWFHILMNGTQDIKHVTGFIQKFKEKIQGPLKDLFSSFQVPFRNFFMYYFHGL